MSDEINHKFQEWSNSVSLECAETQLERFFSTFDNPEQLETWLRAKGFSVGNHRPLNRFEARHFGGKVGESYILLVSWNIKKNGVIFADNMLEWIESMLAVYGVGIQIVYGSNMEVYEVSTSKTRL